MTFRYFALALAAGTLLAGCASMEPEGQYAPGSLAERRAQRDYKPTDNTSMKNWPVNKITGGNGPALDLSGYEVSFNDDFNTMSVTGEDGAGPWYSPVHSDFGGSHFVGPRAGQGPVLVRDGKLVIQMYEEKGKWISSLVQTVNKDGTGFAQQYGYFEVRAKMAAGKATWGGFWLHSHPALTGPRVPQTEIDVAEVYGGDTPGLHKGVHLWPVENMRDGDIWSHAMKTVYNKVDGMFEGYHTYGVMITPETMSFYYDRKAVAIMPTPPEAKTPQYMLLDLTLLQKAAHEAKGTMELEVDYARVWQKKGGY